MFELPLSDKIDCSANENGITFRPYDGKRIPLTLTPEEALQLLQILTQNKKKIEKELNKNIQK